MLKKAKPRSNPMFGFSIIDMEFLYSNREENREEEKSEGVSKLPLDEENMIKSSLSPIDEYTGKICVDRDGKFYILFVYDVFEDETVDIPQCPLGCSAGTEVVFQLNEDTWKVEGINKNVAV